jgi:hypothetical protein
MISTREDKCMEFSAGILYIAYAIISQDFGSSRSNEDEVETIQQSFREKNEELALFPGNFKKRRI